MTLAEVSEDAHLAERGMFPYVSLPQAACDVKEGGKERNEKTKKVRQPGNPIRLSETPATYRHAGYPEGWHTEEILLKLGYSREEMDDLI